MHTPMQKSLERPINLMLIFLDYMYFVITAIT